MMIDISFKDIPGYEGLYGATSCGRIWSYRLNGGKGAFMIPELLDNGYLRIGLSKDGKVKRYRVHRLVALAYLGEPESDDMEIDHIDGDRLNNCVKNLRWVTHKENCAFKDPAVV